MISSGERSPRPLSSSRKSLQASVDSLAPEASPRNTGLPSVVMPHAASTGPGPGAAVHLEAGAIQEQVVQLDLVQTPGRPAVELIPDRLTDPAHGGLAQRSLRAEGVGEGGLHVAHRQAAHEPSDHQRFQRIRLGHPGAKSHDATRSVVPRSFGRSMVTGPAVVLIVVGQ
jgi:hypothetical protein